MGAEFSKLGKCSLNVQTFKQFPVGSNLKDKYSSDDVTYVNSDSFKIHSR